jgi:hypothetical protein
MPMHRRNKAPRTVGRGYSCPWHHAYVRRQRRRDSLSRQMRQVQRRIAKGKQ